MIENNKNSLLVILGNQLFPLEYISQLNINKVYMKEDIELCTYFKHHKMKLTLFLTAMRDYCDLLKNVVAGILISFGSRFLFNSSNDHFPPVGFSFSSIRRFSFFLII